MRVLFHDAPGAEAAGARNEFSSSVLGGGDGSVRLAIPSRLTQFSIAFDDVWYLHMRGACNLFKL